MVVSIYEKHFHLFLGNQKMRNYNNNSSDTAIMLILLVVLPCLAVIYWIQDYFGLDIQTSSEVFGRHIYF